MYRKEKLTTGEYYHVYNRTILNVPEFNIRDNSLKLTQTFLLANSTNSTQAFDYLRNNRHTSIKRALEISKQGEKLTEILCYSIMPNHYHLLIKEIKENGTTDFIRRCNTSIAKYINTKTGRRGPLFESRFKSKHVDSNEYLLHLSAYIHLNPLDFLSSKEWRENKLKSWDDNKEKLLNYPWSSVKYFISSKTDFDENRDVYSNIISGIDIILDQFNNKNDYERFLKEWSVENSEKIKHLLIEDGLR